MFFSRANLLIEPLHTNPDRIEQLKALEKRIAEKVRKTTQLDD